jgi:hypothetical protein
MGRYDEGVYVQGNQQSWDKLIKNRLENGNLIYKSKLYKLAPIGKKHHRTVQK